MKRLGRCDVWVADWWAGIWVVVEVIGLRRSCWCVRGFRTFAIDASDGRWNNITFQRQTMKPGKNCRALGHLQELVTTASHPNNTKQYIFFRTEHFKWSSFLQSDFLHFLNTLSLEAERIQIDRELAA